VLVLEEIIERSQTAQSPSATLLVAAFLEFVSHHDPVIHPGSADLQLTSDSQRAIDVTRPDIGGQAISLSFATATASASVSNTCIVSTSSHLSRD
jgi:hypothetical protein